MTWLGVLPEMQNKKIGNKLVSESLKESGEKYKVCEVKTLSETDSYEPYKKTRAFYKSVGFIGIETIDPYPEWENNPCQIFVKFIGK
jgi:ribosomal protein S18 acetylase RimI-like enzyme